MPPQRPDDSRLFRLEDQLLEVKESLARQDALLEHIATSVDRLADDVRTTKALEPRIVALEGAELRRRGRRKWTLGITASVIAGLILMVAKALAGL